jgi:hypothetical protein
MKKTGLQIESDVFALISNSSLKSFISGQIYKSDTRPINARTEDAVISFLAGIDGQLQVGVLNLNVFVPDIDNGGGDGFLVKNVARCQEIEEKINSIIQSMSISNEYYFELDKMIQTFSDESTNQHLVNSRIRFKRTTF